MCGLQRLFWLAVLLADLRAVRPECCLLLQIPRLRFIQAVDELERHRPLLLPDTQIERQQQVAGLAELPPAAFGQQCSCFGLFGYGGFYQTFHILLGMVLHLQQLAIGADHRAALFQLPCQLAQRAPVGGGSLLRLRLRLFQRRIGVGQPVVAVLQRGDFKRQIRCQPIFASLLPVSL